MKTHECTGNPARFKSGAETSESDPADWDGQILRVSPDFGSPSGFRRTASVKASGEIARPSAVHSALRNPDCQRKRPGEAASDKMSKASGMHLEE